MGLSQHLVEQETILRWCNSDQQLSDGMTKISAAEKVSKFVRSGQRWNLLFDESFTAAKKLKSTKTVEDLPEVGSKDPTWLDLIGTSGHVRTSATVMSSSPQMPNMSSSDSNMLPFRNTYQSSCNMSCIQPVRSIPYESTEPA
jgi:hypothetical protein